MAVFAAQAQSLFFESIHELQQVFGNPGLGKSGGGRSRLGKGGAGARLVEVQGVEVKAPVGLDPQIDPESIQPNQPEPAGAVFAIGGARIRVPSRCSRRSRNRLVQRRGARKPAARPRGYVPGFRRRCRRRPGTRPGPWRRAPRFGPRSGPPSFSARRPAAAPAGFVGIEQQRHAPDAGFLQVIDDVLGQAVDPVDRDRVADAGGP